MPVEASVVSTEQLGNYRSGRSPTFSCIPVLGKNVLQPLPHHLAMGATEFGARIPVYRCSDVLNLETVVELPDVVEGSPIRNQPPRMLDRGFQPIGDRLSDTGCHMVSPEHFRYCTNIQKVTDEGVTNIWRQTLGFAPQAHVQALGGPAMPMRGVHAHREPPWSDVSL